MINLSGKSVLITGGTGSFGSSFCKYLIENDNIPNELYIYSRDWHKQERLKDKLNNPTWISWAIGDVRDKERLSEYIYNINIVIHAAAIKDIATCEQHPSECLLTNVVGTQNVIDVCYLNNVDKAIFISSDKAVMPINVYGTSKKMSEKLWIKANNGYNTKFSVCRYGNVIGSNGSVLKKYEQLIAEGVKSLPVTDERMTRFWYPMNDAINFVIDSLENISGGEVFIPRIPSIRIIDLCEALNMPWHIIGIREGEKLHEYMIPPNEVTGDLGYSSGNNSHFLTVDEIREGIL